MFLSVELSEAQMQSLLRNLPLPASSLASKVQGNLGKIVLYWMGGVSQWELRELVEGLVSSEGLGRYTSALCFDQGNVVLDSL